MTGEITLRGRVLAIGGLKSKILAAHLSGARVVILPKKNEKDLRDVPDEVRAKMKLVLVESMDQVLSAALRRKPKPLKPSPTTAKATEPAGASKATPAKSPVFPPEQPPAVA
jgi:ATP-dependent Lon protease